MVVVSKEVGKSLSPGMLLAVIIGVVIGVLTGLTLLVTLALCRHRRRGRRPASPTSSTQSSDRDNFAVVQYGRTSCDNGMTSRFSDRRPGHHHHQCFRPMQQNPTWLTSGDKLTIPPSTTGRCSQSLSGRPCFQDGGHCPLDAASYHCRRCSAALRAISQSVCCSRPAPRSDDITSGSDVTSATSGVSHATVEAEPALDRSGSEDRVDSGQSFPRYGYSGPNYSNVASRLLKK